MIADPALYTQLSITNPLLVFTVGIVFGSMIGIPGLIVLLLSIASYHYREPLLALLNRFLSTTTSTTSPSPYNWKLWS